MQIGKYEHLEQRIGYHFRDRALLKLALTHSSFANEAYSRKKKNNERLEFLGDAVLELTISEYLYKQYPEHMEGKLTKLRSSLVCEHTLAICARDIDLGSYLLLSKGENLMGGRERDSILSDAFEALIGAIYLDGGLEEVRVFITKNLLKDVEDKALFYDAKTILQEKVQSMNHAKLTYRLTGEKGPDHNKEFFVDALINDEPVGSGRGSSKKNAEQIAAYQALLRLKKEETCI